MLQALAGRYWGSLPKLKGILAVTVPSILVTGTQAVVVTVQVTLPLGFRCSVIPTPGSKLNENVPVVTVPSTNGANDSAWISVTN